MSRDIVCSHCQDKLTRWDGAWRHKTAELDHNHLAKRDTDAEVRCQGCNFCDGTWSREH